MKSYRVAKRYARALLEVAPRDQAEKWGAELEKLAKIVEAPELMSRLASPELPQEAREQAMQKIAERLELSFPLAIVRGGARASRADRGHRRGLAVVPGLCSIEQLGRERATLTFAIQPDDATVQRVVCGTRSDRGKKIIPTIKVDPALLGGVMAEMGGKIYDGSLATRLAEAQQRLAGLADWLVMKRRGERIQKHGGHSTFRNQRNPQERDQGLRGQHCGARDRPRALVR